MPFKVNGAAYDGTSWKVQLPGSLMFEEIFEQMLSLEYDYTREGVEQKKNSSGFSAGTNEGHCYLKSMSMSMYLETWNKLKPRLAALSPKPGQFGLTRVNFSVTLARVGAGGVPERMLIEVKEGRFLGAPMSLKHDASNIPMMITMTATDIIEDGLRP